MDERLIVLLFGIAPLFTFVVAFVAFKIWRESK